MTMPLLKQLFALFLARNKEYYRDKGSLIWSFVIPPIIIAAVSLAFSNGEQALFKVGIYPVGSEMPATLDKDFIQRVDVTDLDKGKVKIQHHQLDILIDQSGDPRYWVNHQSQQGEVLQTLLNTSDASGNQALHHGWQAQALNGREIRYIDWAIPGILSMNLMFSGLFGVGYVIVRYRKNGVLKRLQATPVSPLAFLGAQILSRLLIMLAVSILVYAAANLFLDFVMLGSYLNLLLVALMGNLCILALGLTVASRTANEEAANGLLNVMTFPMLLMSEIWFSLDGAPAWMVSISQCLPLTHMVQAARMIMLDGEGLASIAPHLLILAAMTAGFLLLSAWLFKWRAD